MSFMLGSFSDGLFGGASSMLQLAGQYQNFQDRKAQIDAADEWKKTRDAQVESDKTTQATPIDSTQDYATPVNPTPASPIAPTKLDVTPAKTETAAAAPTDSGTWDAPRAATAAVVDPAAPRAFMGSTGWDPDRHEYNPVGPARIGQNADWVPSPNAAREYGPPQPPQPRDPRLPAPGNLGVVTNRPVGTAVRDWWNGTQTPEQPTRAQQAAGQQYGPPQPAVAAGEQYGPAQPSPPAPASPIAAGPQYGPTQPQPVAPPQAAPQPITPQQATPQPVSPVRHAFNELFGIHSAAAATTGGLPTAQRDTGGDIFSPETPAAGTSVKPAPEPQGGRVQVASTGRAANPAQARTQQTTEQPAPQGGPTAVAMPSQAAPVAPGQKSPTLQSEPTPPIIKAAVPTNVYNGLAPDVKREIDQAAAELHVSPYRLAVTGQHESGFNANARNPASTAKGVGQLLDGTRQQVDPKGELGNSRADQIKLMARYVDYNDRLFGKDSAGSFMGYRAGPENARQFATNFDAMAKAHPDWLRDTEREMGRKLTQADFTSGDLPDPRQLVSAASQGPNQFLRMISQTGNPGMQMYDRWQQAETSLVYAAMRRGDYVGAAHARDLVFSMSHQGMFDNTMQAYTQLAAGDAHGAAMSLAKAHAFFPDGTMGQFGVDGSGNLWAQRVDEHDPSKRMGGAFQVTPDKLTNLLAQTRDPKDYVKYVQSQQKEAETMRHNVASEGLQHEGHMVTAANAAAVQSDRQDYHNLQAEHWAAQDDAKAGALGTSKGMPRLLNDNYGLKAQPMMADGVTPMTDDQKGVASQAFSDIYTSAGGKVAAPEAVRRANGLVHGTMALKETGTGYYAVIDKKNPNTPIGYVSAETAALIKGGELPRGNAPTSTATH